MRRRHGRHCCPTIVHPVQENCVNTCTKECIEHVHPSHTTVMNHHLIENIHVFPHSTSFENTVNSVDIYGGSFEVPSPGPGQVAGAMAPGMGPFPGQVAGAMAPGMGPGMGPFPGQVAGAMAPGMGPFPNQVAGAMFPGGPGMGCHNRPHKWN